MSTKFHNVAFNCRNDGQIMQFYKILCFEAHIAAVKFSLKRIYCSSFVLAAPQFIMQRGCRNGYGIHYYEIIATAGDRERRVNNQDKQPARFSVCVVRGSAEKLPRGGQSFYLFDILLLIPLLLPLLLQRTHSKNFNLFRIFMCI